MSDSPGGWLILGFANAAIPRRRAPACRGAALLLQHGDRYYWPIDRPPEPRTGVFIVPILTLLFRHGYSCYDRRAPCLRHRLLMRQRRTVPKGAAIPL
jgi:hypothetical protein